MTHTHSQVTLEPMRARRLVPWLASSRTAYVDDLVRAGESLDRARERADRSFADLAPGGRLVPEHHVYDVRSGADVVGYLWIGPRSGGGSDPSNAPGEWWVWDISIDAEHRGRGLGRSAMLLAEGAALALGARSLGLNVFGFNTAARGLYESLGYEVQAIQMSKSLEGLAPPVPTSPVPTSPVPTSPVPTSRSLPA